MYCTHILILSKESFMFEIVIFQLQEVNHIYVPLTKITYFLLLKITLPDY